MKYINYFNSFLESVNSLTSYNNWFVEYNDINHNLESRLKERSTIRNTKNFSSLVEKIVDKSIELNLEGDYSFVFPQFNFLQVIVNVDKNKKELSIVTFLSRNMKTKLLKDKIIMNKIYKLNEELKQDKNENHYNFLKSMIFYDDGTHWDFVLESDNLYFEIYNERIDKNMIDIFKLIPNVFNTNKKYRNIETVEEVNNAIDEVYNKLSNQKGIKMTKVF